MKKIIQDFPFSGRYISRIRPGKWRQSVRSHRFLTTLVGAGLIWSVEAQGLGLGDIELKSQLNQPLSAEIALLAVAPGDVDRINIRLADDAAHAAAGVERLDVLSDLIFTKRVDDKGNVEVIITSKVNIKEPYLDFVVEVDWPSGKVSRQYTLLLDPPVFTSQKASAVEEAQVGFSLAEDHASNVATNSTTQTREQSAEAAPSAQAAPASLAGAAADGSNAASQADRTPSTTEEGAITVKRSETLWGVASRIHQNKEFSVEQRMASLYDANPDAFSGGNINNLKAGYVMRVPTEDEVAKHSRSDAIKLARKHYQDWIASRKLSASATKQSDTGSPAPAAMADGAPVDGGLATSQQARLSLVSPEAKSSKNATGAQGGQDGLSGSDLELVMAKAKEGDVEAAAMKARIASLEEQLAMMERLVTLKDDALVELQRQLGGDQSKTPVPAEIAQQGVGEEQTPPTVVPMPATATDNATVQQIAPVSPKEAAAPEPVAKPVAKVAPKPQPAEQSSEDSLLDLLLDPQLLLLGVGALVLIAAAIVVIRKRRQSEEEYAEEDFDPNYAQLDATAAADGKTKNPFAESDLSELAAESLEQMPEVGNFSAQSADTLQADDVDIDPIAEADVYLAYRRFQQAEELIKEAMQRHPERHDLQAKLLEVYFASGNKLGFESQAEALFAALGGQASSVWRSVAEMGRELCPTHPLFGGEAIADETHGGAAVGSDLDFSEIDDFDSSAFDDLVAETHSQTKSGGSADIDELDFSSLNFDVNDEKTTATTNSLDDFDASAFDDFVSSSTDRSEVQDEFSTTPKEKLGEFDFSEQFNFDELAADANAKQEGVGETLSFDESIASLDQEPLVNMSNTFERDEVVQSFETDLTASSGVEEDAQNQLSGLSFEALGADGQSAQTSERDVDPLSDAFGDFETVAVADSSSTTTQHEQNPLDDFTLPAEPQSLESAREDDALDSFVASSPEEGENVTKELNYNYGELEEVFTGLADSELNSATDDDMFGGADMIGTKLDLARAYIDMEDLEGARGILQEVLEEGSDAQKQEAQEMMRKIG